MVPKSLWESKKRKDYLQHMHNCADTDKDTEVPLFPIFTLLDHSYYPTSWFLNLHKGTAVESDRVAGRTTLPSHPPKNTNLKKLVRHDTIIHHRALHPLGRAIAMGVQWTATDMPARKIVSGQKRGARDNPVREGIQALNNRLNKRNVISTWFWTAGSHLLAGAV